MLKFVVLVLIAIFMLSYFIIAYICKKIVNKKNKCYNPWSKIDELIPFNKYFVIPYAIWYPFVFFALIYFMLQDESTFYNLSLCMFLGGCISYLIFLLFPTSISKPSLTNNDFLTNFIRLIYSKDTPYNCFPSIHVLYTTLIILFFIFHVPMAILTIIVSLIGILIILSTICIKQHYFMDLLFGIIIAAILFIHSNTFIAQITLLN